MKKRLLLDNALCAWSFAVRYFEEIEKGKATLQYKKYFVSSLHNAVELFMKQMMLDNHQNDVVEIRVKASDKKAKDEIPEIKKRLTAEIENAKDLNQYFDNVYSNSLNQDSEYFYSIDFWKLIKNYDRILKGYPWDKEVFDVFRLVDSGIHVWREYDSGMAEQRDPHNEKKNRDIFVNGLQILQRLRNAETHFYVNQAMFLCESEFRDILRFMCVFWRILEEKFADLKNVIQKFAKSGFEIDGFTYREALINSNMAQSIRNVAKKLVFEEEMSENDSVARLVDAFSTEHVNQWLLRYGENEYFGEPFAIEDLFTYFEMFKQFNLIRVNRIKYQACQAGTMIVSILDDSGKETGQFKEEEVSAVIIDAYEMEILIPEKCCLATVPEF